MKKRIFAMLMALIMVATLIGGAIPALADNDLITVRLHYHREDGEYEGWNMWFWDEDSITTLESPYYFEETDENGGVVATIQVKPGTTRIGYIVRTDDWKKDVEHDQYINITGVLAGTVDFYVESGVPTQPDKASIPTIDKLIENGNLVLGDDVKTGVVITANAYKTTNRNGHPEITLQLSSRLPDDYVVDTNTFTVSNSDGVIPLAEETDTVKPVRVAGQYVYLVLSEQLNLARNYNITFEGRDYAVTMPDYYSHEEFEGLYTYTGDDLGATYSPEKTDFRVWAPTAVAVSVRLYADGDKSVQMIPDDEIPMEKAENGTWVASVEGDLNGTYYTYLVDLDTTVNEACDPYARTTGINGERAMVIDLDSTNPEGWAEDTNPHAGENFTDAVIYELHVRDLSSDASSGIQNAGKFLGLIEAGTKTPGGVSTGLDHMVDLGITHVHLLPSYDYGSVDETKMDDPDAKKFNWGYDPQNYNVPEGSYSTDPYHGEVRVKEFKQMVKGLHNAGISVVMDVVYNHVYDANRFCFNKIVPGYFTRPGANGSGCGNDVASERAMVSKYIVDSVYYWATEYHVDGFRFDLAGLIDTDTINTLMTKVKEVRPDVVFYGEGWAAGSTKLTKNGYELTVMANAAKVPGFAFFSDTIRNEVKGGTYGGVNPGFISGGSYNTATLLACFKGMPSWCPTPSQSINYISAHDNNTLFDHITLVTSNVSVADRIKMNNLGAAFYMTSQGIPFFQAGEEMLRSKPDASKPDGFNENSYNASDEINSLKWSDLEKDEYQATYQYYKGLIAFRKAHPALRLTDSVVVSESIFALSNLPANMVGYQVEAENENIIAIFNAAKSAGTVTLPAGDWDVYVNGTAAGTTVLESVSGSVSVDALSAMILVAAEGDPIDPPPTDPTDPSTEPTDSSSEITEPSSEPEASEPQASEPVASEPVASEPEAPSSEANEPSSEPEAPSTEAPAPSTEATQPADKAEEKDGGSNIWLFVAIGAVAVVAIAAVVIVMGKKKS